MSLKINNLSGFGSRRNVPSAPAGDYVQVTDSPNGDGTTNIEHPDPGYTGTLDIFLCGITSRTPNNYANENNGYNAPGEAAYFSYTCLGDEEDFDLIQANLNSGAGGSTGGRLRLVVNGGANNGKYLEVGSGRGNNTGYGHGGACNNLSGGGTLTATRNNYGACRPFGSTLYYSDETNYGPDNFADYGDSFTTDFEVAGDSAAIVMPMKTNLSASQYGLQYRPTSGDSYQQYSVITHSIANSASRLSQANDGYGVCILVWKND